jgi:F0F1-type ATP synthase membrane subunit a
MPYFMSLQTLPTMVFLRFHLYIRLVLFVQTNTSMSRFFTLKLFGGTQSLIRVLVQRLEVVRSLVRSLRLGLRILANLTMGHLLISLLYQLPLGSGLFLCFFLYMFELFVGLVQALVFVRLFLMYMRETQE